MPIVAYRDGLGDDPIGQISYGLEKGWNPFVKFLVAIYHMECKPLREILNMQLHRKAM